MLIFQQLRHLKNLQVILKIFVIFLNMSVKANMMSQFYKTTSKENEEKNLKHFKHFIFPYFAVTLVIFWISFFSLTKSMQARLHKFEYKLVGLQHTKQKMYD